MTGTAGDDHLGVATGGPLDVTRDVYRGGPGLDTLHLHEDLHGLETRGCERIVIRLAG